MRSLLAIALACAALLLHAGPPQPARFEAAAFGATGDGVTTDTPALQRAIDACAGAGGGTVYVGPGRYLTGTLFLKSHVTLHLADGAVLLGSTRIEDYPAQAPAYQHAFILLGSKQSAVYPMRHLLYARDAEDVVLEGRGVIDGQGDAFFSADMKEANPRPTPLLEFIGVRNLRVENIIIRQAPGWTLHTKACDDVRIRGITIQNNLHAINSDGIDIDSSRNVIISDCRIAAGDDCIVLKTTRMGDATPPVENVVVTNCVLESAASALKLGTESHGDFRHVLFSQCVIRNSRTGIGLFAKDGGTMEDVRFNGIVMTTRPKWGQGLEWPIVVELSRRAADSRLSTVRDVAFSDVAIYTNGRIMVSGSPQRPIEGVRFQNVSMRVGGYETLKGASHMGGGAASAESKGANYGAIPAAMIVTLAKDVTLDGISVRWPAEDPAQPAPARYALYGDRIDRMALARLDARGSLPTVEPVRIENSTRVTP